MQKSSLSRSEKRLGAASKRIRKTKSTWLKIKPQKLAAIRPVIGLKKEYDKTQFIRKLAKRKSIFLVAQ